MAEKNKKTMGTNIIVLIILTLFLKIVGFINRVVIAYFFGTTTETDIYYTASGFVESISAVLLAGLTVGIINIYIRNKGKKDTNIFISNIVTGISLLTSTVMILCIIFSNDISHVLALSYSDDLYSQMSNLLRILIIAIPFQGLVTIFGAVLQAENRFTPVRLTGTVSSFVSIVCVIVLHKYIGVYALVVSFVVGYFLNAVFLRINLRKVFKYRIYKFYKDENVKELIFLVLPLIIGLAGHEINLIIDKSVASQITEGAVSALSYSCVLYLLIENVIINSIVTAIFPNMTEMKKEGKENELAVSAKRVIFFAECLLIPIVICTFLNAENITELIYFRGSFDEKSLLLTSAALQGYVIGLPFLAIRDIITRVYYAYSDTKTPVAVNLISVGINIFLDFALYKAFGVMGITFATSFANAFSGIVMLLRVKKCNRYILDKELLKELGIICIPMVLSLVVTYYIAVAFQPLLALLLSAFVTFGIELIFMYLGKSNYLQFILKLVKEKINIRNKNI